MDSNELKREINRHLFVPIEDSHVERLHEVVTLLTADVDICVIETYMQSFFSNSISISFKKLFNERYNERYGDEILLPDIAYIILELYFVRQCVHSDTVGALLKLQISYIVKNFAILKKGSLEEVMCAEWILSIYQYSDKYACKPAGGVNYDTFINKILPYRNWNETGLDLNSQDVFDQLRSLSVAGMRDRVNTYVKSRAFADLVDPFVQIYTLAEKLVNEWNWKYISASPIGKMKSVLECNENKRKKLANITDTIRNILPETEIVKPKMRSSILLKKIYDNKKCGLDGDMFSALEFGVYLYYELLLESYNN